MIALKTAEEFVAAGIRLRTQCNLLTTIPEDGGKISWYDKESGNIHVIEVTEDVIRHQIEEECRVLRTRLAVLESKMVEEYHKG